MKGDLKSPRALILRPIVSEKSYALMGQNKYVFVVHPKAKKMEIKKAIEEIFNVDVAKVNTVSVKGKPKRLGQTSGRRSNWKKAIVTLKEGNKIEIFEGL